MRDQPIDGKWAVVLCGGRGSRMGSHTERVPKPLIKVHGEPILWYVFRSLYRHGIRNFIFPLGYLGEAIEEFVTNTARDMDCNILCVDTGVDSDISQRIHQIKHLIPEHEDFFVLNSDTIFDFDIESMYELHKAENALVTLSSVEVVSHWGLILMKDEKLVGFDRERKVRHLIDAESRELEGHVNSGLAWVNKDALELVDLATTGGDFETILYGRAIEAGRAAHFRLEGYWFPIDTPKDLHIMNLNVGDRHDSGEMAKAVKDSLSEVLPEAASR